MNRRIIGYYNYTVVLTYLGMIAAVIGVFLAIGGFFGQKRRGHYRRHKGIVYLRQFP